MIGEEFLTVITWVLAKLENKYYFRDTLLTMVKEKKRAFKVFRGLGIWRKLAFSTTRVETYLIRDRRLGHDITVSGQNMC